MNSLSIRSLAALAERFSVGVAAAAYAAGLAAAAPALRDAVEQFH